MRHCKKKFAATDRLNLILLSHSFTLDGLLHCRTKEQAEYVLKRIEQRFRTCGLELQEKKTRIIYCKDKNRVLNHEHISFDFLGYTFKPRRCVDKKGVVHPNFLPAISRDAQKAISKTIRKWNIACQSDKSIFDLSRMFNPMLIGWYNYYGLYYSTAMNKIWQRINWYLVRWVRRKYKKFAIHKLRAINYLSRLAKANKNLFKHWSLGIF